MFSKFKDITSDNELRASEELEQHAMLVMNVLDEAITHIDNYDYIQNILVPAGKVHLKVPGFRPETFYVSMVDRQAGRQAGRQMRQTVETDR
jgi:hypothetical protein